MSMSPPNTTAPKLEAEKKFDQAVYGGISYFAQAATGIVVARWIRDGGGRKYFDAMSRWAGPNIISKISKKTGEEAIKAADSPIVVSTMIMVGNAFLIPVKFIENHKPAIVRKWQYALNEKRQKKGETISAEELTQQENLLEALDKKPKQTWTSLGLARAASLVGVYAAVFGIGTKNNIKAEIMFADAVQNGMKKVGLTNLGESSTASSYLRMIFNDGFYSAVSAGGLYLWSHFVCPPKHDENGVETITVPSAPALTVISENTSEKPTGKLAEQEEHTLDKPTSRMRVTAHSGSLTLAGPHSERMLERQLEPVEMQR